MAEKRYEDYPDSGTILSTDITLISRNGTGTYKSTINNLLSSVSGGLELQGNWDASTGNVPSLTPTTGYFWIITVAGTILGTPYAIGDWIVWSGSAWFKVLNSNTDSLLKANNLSDLLSFPTSRKNITSGLNTNLVYVSQLGGNDTIGNGNILNPFKSYAAAYNSITTASVTNPFTIIIMGGFMDDSGGQIKIAPYINVKGETAGTIISNAMPIIADISPWSLNTSGIYFLENLNIGNSYTLDFSSISASGAGATIQHNNVTVSGTFSVKGNSTYTPQIYNYTSYFSGICNFDNVSIPLSFSNYYASLNCATIVSGSACTFISQADQIFDFVGNGPSSGDILSIYFIEGAVINDSISCSGTNTELFIDSSSLGQNPTLSITGGAQIKYLDNAAYINENYSPTHYSPSSLTVEGHFEGIDTKIGTLQVSGNYITALSGDVSASGPGSASSTVNHVGGQTAANVAAATLLANAATNSDTASTIVKRDGGGAFSMGTLTCGGLTANMAGGGSSAFSLTGTNAAVNISTTSVLGQASSTGAFFSAAVSGDFCIRQGGTSNSLYLGVGSSAPQFQITNSYCRSTSQLLVSGNTTYASAAFVVNSTTQGSILSSMTTTQKTSISSPTSGTLVYDNVLGKYCFYSAVTSTWQTITSV
jgi:hypothetical protein